MTKIKISEKKESEIQFSDSFSFHIDINFSSLIPKRITEVIEEHLVVID